MKKLFALLTLLAFLILLWFAKDKHQSCCEDYVANQQVIPKKEVVVVEKTGPLVYKWENTKPFTNNLWSGRKTKIIKALKEGSILRIIGPYFSDERNISTFKNMGLARASKVKELFASDLDTSKIEIRSRVIEYYDGAKTKVFEKTAFAWIVQNENIKEDETGKALIYFPYGSAKEIKNANILNYVKTIAEKAKKSGKTVYLTGYTDNTGNAAKNKALGLRRANSVKRLLIKYGVAEDKIKATSLGIENPIASNDTAKGRAQNRRVALKIK
jgi:outer membrane protein OmpA-like peptidoglycan-associated protein